MDRASFRWVPGRGPDSDAIARLRQAFPKPPQPMGEAWFMGADWTFDELPEVAEVMRSLDATGAAFDALLT